MPTGIVAVGFGLFSNPVVSYSIDNGYTWTAGSGITFTEGFTVAYNGSLWVAGGEGSPGQLQNIATSTDGINWTPRNCPGGRCVAWNGSYWLAGGGAQKVFKSFDGITWTPYSTTIGGVGGTVLCLAWGAGTWVAGGGIGNNSVATSPDGETWTTVTQFNADPTKIVYAFDIVWDGGKFVMMTQQGSTTPRVQKCYSPDGSDGSWTGVAPIAASGVSAYEGFTVGYNGSYFICQARDDVNWAQRSADGITWTYIADPIAQAGFLATANFAFKQIIWTGTEWIFARLSTPILHSADGNTWTQSTPLGAPYAFAVGDIVIPQSPFPFPQQYQNIHLRSGNDIVPYSTGAVVPPAIPSIPARTIENIKLPNGPKDVACNTAARCHPIAPYRNVPEPAVTPSNPGQRLDCIARGALPYANYGTPYNRYSPQRQGTYTVGYNRLAGSRIAETWPPPSNK